MRREFLLQPAVWFETPLEFAWDEAAGTITGRDAHRVIELCDDAKADGSVTTHPMPTTYPITDPYRSAADLALVLGQWWVLDAYLAQARPQPPDPEPWPEDLPPPVY